MNRERGRPQLRFGEQLLILLEKEWLQMVRDPAVIFMGALLPVVLIVLFGWGFRWICSKCLQSSRRANQPP